MRRTVALAWIAISVCAAAPAQAQLPSTGGQVWGAAKLWLQFPSHFRVVAGAELNDGTNYDYTQWSGRFGVGYQWKRLHSLDHLVNINEDKESQVSASVGYEYLWTEQAGDATTTEDRIALAVTPRHRPFPRWLLEDRNRVELRWVNGAYSTRYRNRLSVERDIRVHSFRFTPYASAEFYYDFAKSSWNEQHYSAGVQWPYRRILMIDTYYVFQHSTTAPDNVNVLGVTLNVYLRNGL